MEGRGSLGWRLLAICVGDVDGFKEGRKESPGSSYAVPPPSWCLVPSQGRGCLWKGHAHWGLS